MLDYTKPLGIGMIGLFVSVVIISMTGTVFAVDWQEVSIKIVPYEADDDIEDTADIITIKNIEYEVIRTEGPVDWDDDPTIFRITGNESDGYEIRFMWDGTDDHFDYELEDYEILIENFEYVPETEYESESEYGSESTDERDHDRATYIMITITALIGIAVFLTIEVFKPSN